MNLSITDFLEIPPFDRALRIARDRVKALAQAYEHHLSEEEAKARRRKKKK